MKKNQKYSEKFSDDCGFTLIELMIAMVIGSLVLLSLRFVFTENQTVVDHYVEDVREANMVMYLCGAMARDILAINPQVRFLQCWTVKKNSILRLAADYIDPDRPELSGVRVIEYRLVYDRLAERYELVRSEQVYDRKNISKLIAGKSMNLSGFTLTRQLTHLDVAVFAEQKWFTAWDSHNRHTLPEAFKISFSLHGSQDRFEKIIWL